ncbi:hypothetical protein [Desulfitobacterium hafniense]|nr:hypothetical protein [Desulfitobacterium hafniense]
MSLSIVAGDVLTQMGDIFNAIWPILAIGLGLLATPKLIGAAKTAFSGRN